MRRGSRGFTLIEALVAATLLGTGIVAVLSGLSHITAADIRNRQVERMQRLAVAKYNELVSTGQVSSASNLSGDFAENGDDIYSWEADVEPSSVTDLDSLTVTVKPKSGSSTLDSKVEGLIYVQPDTTGAAGGTTP